MFEPTEIEMRTAPGKPAHSTLLTQGAEEPMADLEYAPEGYHFARVSTPNVYREYLVPIDGVDMAAEEEEHYEELRALAEQYRTSINAAVTAADEIPR